MRHCKSKRLTIQAAEIQGVAEGLEEMTIHNADIAAIFEEMADLLELEQSNLFRVRAYRNAARTIRAQSVELKSLIARGDKLTALPAIGKNLAGRIHEIVSTGRCSMLNNLRKKTPHILVELLSIPGLGPKKVRALNQELDIHTMEQLARAARDGRISEIPGFGRKSEESLAKAIKTYASKPRRMKLAIAAQYAEPLAEYLRLTPGVKQVVIAGSYRRFQETVGDVDILASADYDSAVMEKFTEYDEVARILSKGQTRATVVLNSGLQVDLRVVPEESFGAALVYLTGSKEHNVAIRSLGQHMGLKINEYGVFRNGLKIAGASEDSVYKSVGLSFIPPELRENRGEIESAKGSRIARLVELGDLRGDLHSHTKASDGKNSIREMVEAAKKHGLEYLAISEHSKRLAVAHGLTADRLLTQMAEIDRLNEELDGFTLLKAAEVDILEDGSLDLPDEILARLDLVIGSVHSHFNLSREQQTTRILKAMNHPAFRILGHPSGRLIAEREPYDVDMHRVIHHAKSRGCFLELNAHPERLDLLDIYCRMAKEEGVLISINSDAHSVHDFDNLKFGIGQARRGWLEKKDVLNACSLSELRRLLRIQKPIMQERAIL